MGNFVEAQRTINAQLSQKIDTIEKNVNKRIDGLQSEMEQNGSEMTSASGLTGLKTDRVRDWVGHAYWVKLTSA